MILLQVYILELFVSKYSTSSSTQSNLDSHAMSLAPGTIPSQEGTPFCATRRAMPGAYEGFDGPAARSSVCDRSTSTGEGSRNGGSDGEGRMQEGALFGTERGPQTFPKQVYGGSHGLLVSAKLR